MAGGNPFNRKAKRHPADVDAARARWGLVFYCWRNVLVLSVATAVTADTILAIVEGRPSHTLDALSALLRQL